MFTSTNLILGSAMVATGLVGWWFFPVAVAAGLVGDLLGRTSTTHDDEE